MGTQLTLNCKKETATVLETPLPRRKPAACRLLRKLHFGLAVFFTLNFLVLLGTGLAVQHREWLSLEGSTVSRKWLPAGYRPDDPEAEVRADIVLTDLHSGRILGPRGPLFVDAAAAGWLLIMASGYGMQFVSRMRNKNL